MVAVTYGVRVPAGKAKTSSGKTAKAAPVKSWFARFMVALMEARMEQARREVERHVHLLPYTFDEHGNRLVKIGGRNIPLGGW
jgi:hypothetical protein